MVNKIREYIQKNRLLEGCGHVVLGLSGGADSVCLLTILDRLKKEFGYEISALHVHHGIRGKEADSDVGFCTELCHKLGVEFLVKYVDIPAIAKETGESLEEAGRRIRYDFFAEQAQKWKDCKIAVAHHGNDRAETILFNLIRGTGIKGLRGISAIRDNVIRPLLCVERREIEDFLTKEGVSYCSDSTNACNDYARNKIRNVVFPCLEEINSATVKNIGAMADKVEELSDFIAGATELAYSKCAKEETRGVTLYGLDKEHRYIAKNLIIRGIYNVTGKLKDITETHISNIYELLFKTPGAMVDIKYGVFARIDTDGLFIGHKRDLNNFEIEIETPSDITMEGGRNISFRKILWNNNKKIINQVYTKYFDYDKIRFGLQLRTRKDGDFLVVDKEGHRKKLNQFFIDQKIPGRKRDEILLLADGNHILWIIGYRISEAYKVTEDTKNVLQVECGGFENV